MDYETAKNYSDWLSTQNFHYFFTGTYREDYTIDGSRRSLQRFFGKHEVKPEFAFLCIESGKMYGRIHTHGLLRYPEGGIFHPGRLISDAWEKTYGYSRMEVPRSRQSVTLYCTKYAVNQLKADTYLIL